MLVNLLYGLFILACLVLVAAVLLQPGKSDAGALFTSNVSSTAFGPRGTQSVLAKITIGAAISFMLLAFFLSQPALTGNRSVLDTTAAPAESPTPMASPDTNANSAASTAASPEQATNANIAASNANTATNANADASNANADSKANTKSKAAASPAAK